LHELSHAWHCRYVTDGYDNKDILECYESAMKEGLYDCVPFHTLKGRNAESRAYACENAQEYFAELSVAFLSNGCDDNPDEAKNEEKESDSEDGGKENFEYNKWFPFHRKQLEEHDPRAFTLLQRMWGLKFRPKSGR